MSVDRPKVNASPKESQRSQVIKEGTTGISTLLSVPLNTYFPTVPNGFDSILPPGEDPEDGSR